jgi:hypothetical protein
VTARSLLFSKSRLHSCAEGELEPVCAIVAKQDEVNHRCKQEQEYALSHENAAWVENQPDLVELCHMFFSLPAEPRKLDVRQHMSNHCDERKEEKTAHVYCVQLLGLLVSETCER